MKLATRLFVLCLSLFAAPTFAGEDDWATYKDEHYGFSMLMPAGARFKESEAKDGWGALQASGDGVEFLAIAKLGTEAAAADIEKVGVRVTGVSADHWKEIDKGSGNGWKWFKTVEASDGKNLLFGGYGVGPKGSYLVLVKTTEADYKEHKADYKEWYDSVKLQ
jgi:hypothetical protein